MAYKSRLHRWSLRALKVIAAVVFVAVFGFALAYQFGAR